MLVIVELVAPGMLNVNVSFIEVVRPSLLTVPPITLPLPSAPRVPDARFALAYAVAVTVPPVTG